MQEIVDQARELLMLEKFQAWLEQFPPQTIVGFSRSAGYNPIACYLSKSISLESIADTSIIEISVDKDWVWVSKEENETVFINEKEYNESGEIPEVPKWISETLRKFNRLSAEKHPGGISAEVAFQVVKDIAIALKKETK